MRLPLIALAVTICISVCALLLILSPPFSPTTPDLHSSTDWDVNETWLNGPEDEPFDPVKRYSLDYGNVACWQNEGVWIKYLSPVELASIGLDRFQDTERSLNQTEEDIFCGRLRMYGASFWSLPPRWPTGTSWCSDIDSCVQPDVNVNLTIAFPNSGGVCVLNNTQGWGKLTPYGLGLHNALTMEERCSVIEKLGGKFCESMEACPETAALVRDMEVVNRSLTYY